MPLSANQKRLEEQGGEARQEKSGSAYEYRKCPSNPRIGGAFTSRMTNIRGGKCNLSF